MSKDRSKRKHSDLDRLTPDILRKYHKGELSSDEMHSVERRLLEDEFAAEAMEGFEAMEDPDSLSGIVSELNAQIDEKTGTSNRKTIPLWVRAGGIAASLIVLILAVFMVKNLTEPNIEQELAISPLEDGTPSATDERSQQNDTVELAIAGKSDKSTQLDETDENVQSNEEVEGHDHSEESKHSRVLKEIEKEQLTDLNTDDENSRPIENLKSKEISEITALENDERLEEVVADIPDVETTEKIEYKTQKETTFEQSKEKKLRSEQAFSIATSERGADVNEGRSRLAAPSIAHRTITGFVNSADDGSALPGVNVFVKGKSNGVITDINGQFKIPIEVADSTLTFSFIGYESEELKLNTSNDVEVDLESDVTSLDEVLIISYNHEHDVEKGEYISAAPKGGNSAYKKYLQDSLHYPNEAIINRVEGKVKVAFYVQSNGVLSDFQVKRSLGYGCDEEVIRLIKEGPKWTPAKKDDLKVRQKVKVRLRFRLPKKR
ncbi:TonB family protein [Fulvivirgaceae bacterium BMA10]|uniref:TonB family protein n=1 Tax=Splendidivirga corallicola TaxID=3051826 RepID=A0ABT8KTH0_9BACT|nr:TonB family protein [Fulvivirgaceae bacterium BMA10]